MSRSRRWLAGTAMALSLLLACPATAASAQAEAGAPDGGPTTEPLLAAEALRKVDPLVLRAATGAVELTCRR